jgi:hypothetical protein
MHDILLIHPPVVKPSEPPAGIARLCGALVHHGIRNTVLDANLEGLLHFLKVPPETPDTWTSRALRHLPNHLDSLRSWKAYRKDGLYRRAVKDLNRLLEMAARTSRVRLSLANYEHETLSPARSKDLIQSAEHPEENPFYPYFRERLIGLLKKQQPSVIGLSLNYLSQVLCTFAIIGFLKRETPRIKLALGGGLVTSWMRRPHWQNPFKDLVDLLVAGPGEAALLSLIHVTPAQDISHHPVYDAFSLNDYLAPGPILPYSASSGCYWQRCSFCPERAEGNPYVPIPVEETVRDLHRLVERYQPVLVHFLDNAVSPSLMKAILKRPPGVPWYGFARATRPLTDLDFCIALKRAGCVMLKLGLESGDQTVLDGLEKGIHLEEVSSVLSNLKKAGIAAYVYLLFGTPPEGLMEARRTLEFVVKHHEFIHFLNLAIFNMPIDGSEFREMKATGFYEGDLSLYTGFDHPMGWSKQRVRQFLDKEFKRHPAIGQILRRDPPVFTSNHAPFFLRDFRSNPFDAAGVSIGINY